MKTYKEWATCYRHLDIYLKPGDEIDRDMVEYFRNQALNRTKRSDFIQFREPYEHYRNADGKFHNVYVTIRQKEGRWFYAGLCFAGKTEPAVHHIFVRETFRRTDFGMTFYKSLNLPLEYVKNQDNWYSVISGKIDGHVRAGLMIHIIDKNGRELSVETTTENLP